MTKQNNKEIEKWVMKHLGLIGIILIILSGLMGALLFIRLNILNKVIG